MKNRPNFFLVASSWHPRWYARYVRHPREDLVSARMSRGCYEDATRNLFPWNLSFRQMVECVTGATSLVSCSFWYDYRLPVRCGRWQKSCWWTLIPVCTSSSTRAVSPSTTWTTRRRCKSSRSAIIIIRPLLLSVERKRPIVIEHSLQPSLIYTGWAKKVKHLVQCNIISFTS